MPPKRVRDPVLDAESPGLPARGSDAGGLDTLLQTVYNDLRAAREQIASEQERSQTWQIQLLELKAQANRLQAESETKEAEIARLRAEVARLQSLAPQPSSLSNRASPPEDRNVYVFKLEKAAKSRGGDKFVCESQPEFQIYFPQTISRQGAAVPCQFLRMRVEQPAAASAASPSVSLQQQNAPIVLSIKNGGVKQEPVSDDDDVPLVLNHTPGSVMPFASPRS
jgi:hypothetical protein